MRVKTTNYLELSEDISEALAARGMVVSVEAIKSILKEYAKAKKNHLLEGEIVKEAHLGDTRIKFRRVKAFNLGDMLAVKLIVSPPDTLKQAGIQQLANGCEKLVERVVTDLGITEPEMMKLIQSQKDYYELRRNKEIYI